MDGRADPTRRPGAARPDFRITAAIQGWARRDPAPARQRPFPIQLLEKVAAAAARDPNPKDECRRDLIVIAFFFLLRAGEYNYSMSESATPFRLMDVELWRGEQRIDIMNAPAEQLLAATASYLVYTMQKNGVRNERIGHGVTGHPVINPTTALARRIIHHRQHHAPRDTALYNYYVTAQRKGRISASDISGHLQLTAQIWGAQYGFHQSHASSHSLRIGGATALLAAGVPKEVIMIMGRWQSDSVFRYWHADALPHIDALAARMLTRGGIAMVPNHALPP
jgi:hypothetical protein